MILFYICSGPPAWMAMIYQDIRITMFVLYLWINSSLLTYIGISRFNKKSGSRFILSGVSFKRSDLH